MRSSKWWLCFIPVSVLVIVLALSVASHADIQQPAHFLGTFTVNDCGKASAQGFLVSAGAPCGSGSGGTIAATTNTLTGDGAGNAIAAIGTPANCVHVDGSSAPCGTAAPAFTLLAQTNGIPVGATGGTTAAMDTTGANLIIVNVEGVAPFSVTDSQSNTYLAGIQHGESRIYYKLAPVNDTALTVTWTGAVSNVQVEVWKGGSALDTQNGATPSGAPGPATCSVSNCLYVAGIAGGNNQMFFLGYGFTVSDQFQGSGVSVPGAMAYLLQGAAYQVDPTWMVAGAGTLSASMLVFAP